MLPNHKRDAGPAGTGPAPKKKQVATSNSTTMVTTTTDATVHRLGVTLEQALELQHLGSAPKKTTWKEADGPQRRFHGAAIEVEAMETTALRDLLTAELEDLIPPNVLHVHQMVEAEERAGLRTLIGGWS